MAPINDVCRYTTVERKFAGGSRSSRLLCSNKLLPPNPKCFVCNKSEIDLYIDIHKTKFSLFLESIIKKKLAFVEASVTLNGYDIIYEEGEDFDPEQSAVLMNKELCNLPA